MVIDTSALLSVLFNEPTASWVLEQLDLHKGQWRMSTVNLAEVFILVKKYQPQLYKTIETNVLSKPIRYVPPQIKHVQVVAVARDKYPINLGDCFAYALAMDEGCPLLTLDKDFKKTDVQVLIPR
ncbi:type II toxin-antitoxin system VapC family toxin [bacterium]|nr:type II toxin-antitoxin system VapC family toxin [bacterium]